jgi:uncharacterized protein
MTIGLLTVEFMTRGCRSLKEKRAVVKSITAKLKNRFNVSVAETGALNSFRQGGLAVAVVSNNARHANSMLDKALDYIEGLGLVDIAEINTEII